MIEMTATGIEALTVRPTLSTRYSDEAPKMMPEERADDHRARRELAEDRVGSDVRRERRRALGLEAHAVRMPLRNSTHVRSPSCSW